MRTIPPMVSMELDDEDQYDLMPCGPAGDRPRFPYGLHISLTEKELEKMGFDPSSFMIGGVIHIHALARIDGINVNDSERGSTCSISAQIEDMDIESEDKENEDE